jgi:hypothetical protein
MAKQVNVGDKGGGSGGKVGSADLPKGAGANISGAPATPKK